MRALQVAQPIADRTTPKADSYVPYQPFQRLLKQDSGRRGRPGRAAGPRTEPRRRGPVPGRRTGGREGRGPPVSGPMAQHGDRDVRRRRWPPLPQADPVTPGRTGGAAGSAAGSASSPARTVGNPSGSARTAGSHRVRLAAPAADPAHVLPPGADLVRVLPRGADLVRVLPGAERAVRPRARRWPVRLATSLIAVIPRTSAEAATWGCANWPGCCRTWRGPGCSCTSSTPRTVTT